MQASQKAVAYQSSNPANHRLPNLLTVQGLELVAADQRIPFARVAGGDLGSHMSCVPRAEKQMVGLVRWLLARGIDQPEAVEVRRRLLAIHPLPPQGSGCIHVEG